MYNQKSLQPFIHSIQCFLNKSPNVAKMVRENLWSPYIMQGNSPPTQVHADASNFAEDITKEEAYQQVLDQAEGLFYEQRNWVNYSYLPSVHMTTDTHTLSRSATSPTPPPSCGTPTTPSRPQAIKSTGPGSTSTTPFPPQNDPNSSLVPSRVK